jgi:hypothetical protein
MNITTQFKVANIIGFIIGLVGSLLLWDQNKIICTGVWLVMLQQIIERRIIIEKNNISIRKNSINSLN